MRTARRIKNGSRQPPVCTDCCPTSVSTPKLTERRGDERGTCEEDRVGCFREAGYVHDLARSRRRGGCVGGTPEDDSSYRARRSRGARRSRAEVSTAERESGVL